MADTSRSEARVVVEKFADAIYRRSYADWSELFDSDAILRHGWLTMTQTGKSQSR